MNLDFDSRGRVFDTAVACTAIGAMPSALDSAAIMALDIIHFVCIWAVIQQKINIKKNRGWREFCVAS